MQKGKRSLEKKLMVIVGVITALLIVLAIGFTFSYADDGLRVISLSYTPGNNSVIVSVTDDDFTRYPALKTAMETSGVIIVTENPFIHFRYGELCVTKYEAMLIEEEFGVIYRVNDSNAVKSRYLKWKENYYEVYRFYV